MKIDRRTVLGLSGYALAASLVPVGAALAAADFKSLTLVEPFGPHSLGRTAFDILRPTLQTDLGGPVTIETVRGHDGFDAIGSILDPKPGEPRVFGGSVMGSQFIEKQVAEQFSIESLTPIVKLTNGFSVTLFTKNGSPLKAWQDLAAAKPLKVSSLMRSTATYLAGLMAQRKGGLAAEFTFRDSVAGVVEEVMSGRCAVGIINTPLVASQPDRLQPIVTFGALRNAMLSRTPTFAEIMGNPKLAFTECLGVFAAPKIDAAVAAGLTKAFMVAGQEPDVLNGAEAAMLPLAISGPEILAETMQRNEGVLSLILG